VFETGARAAVAKEGAAGAAQMDRLASVVELYTGDAFEGLYADWAVQERERLRFVFLECLRCQMQHLASQGDYVSAISCGARILKLDPLQESVHRALIRLHLERGNRGLAAKQFEMCRRLLRTELGIQPEPQTWELWRSFGGRTSGIAPADVSQLRCTLCEIRRLLEIAERQLEIVMVAHAKTPAARTG